MGATGADWDGLAAAHGGRVEAVPVEGDTDGTVAYGVLEGLVWTVIGQGDVAYVIEVDTCLGGSIEAVHADLKADPALVGALAEAAGPSVDDALGVRPELVQLRLVSERGGVSVGAPLTRLVRALVDGVRRHATLIEDGCWGCGAPQTPVGRPFGQTVRLCPTCQEAARQEEAALEAKAVAEGQVDVEVEDEAAFQAVVFGGADHERLRQRGLRLAARAEANPAAFRAALVGWVLAGQALLASGAVIVGAVAVAVLFAVLGLVLTGRALALVLVAKLLLLKLWKLLVFAAIGVAAAGRTLWSAMQRRYGPAPVRPGVRLTRDEAPGLFGWLDGLAARVGAPPPDVVFVDMALNASAGEHQDQGAWRRVVTVGVPFLELFSVRELEAIMAHELGHLRHDDARELWVFRTVDAWRRAVLASDGLIGALVQWIARWYLPEFLLRAQVVSRHREQAADAAALGVAPAELQVRALSRIGVVGALLDRALRIAARRVLVMPGDADPYDVLWESLPAIPDAVVQEAYRDALEAPTHWLDSHPGLRERIAALGLEPPPRVEIVGDDEPRSATVVDRWLEVREGASGNQRKVAVLQVERVRRQERRRLARLAAIDEKLATEPDLAAAHMVRARLLSAGDDDPAALAAYQRVVALDPSHRDGWRELAHLLVWVARADEAGRAADALVALPEPSLDDRQFAAEVWARAGRVDDAERALRALADDEELPDELRGAVLQRADVLHARAERALQGPR